MQRVVTWEKVFFLLRNVGESYVGTIKVKWENERDGLLQLHKISNVT